MTGTVSNDRLEQLIGSGTPNSREIHDMAVELIISRRAALTASASEPEPVAWECYGEDPGHWHEPKHVVYDADLAAIRTGNKYWTVRPLVYANPVSPEDENYLQEIADGAWGDNPRIRGLARDRLAAVPTPDGAVGFEVAWSNWWKDIEPSRYFMKEGIASDAFRAGWEAALSHPADGWRGIESAPRDGTPILALCLSPLDREPSLLAIEVIWFDGEWLFGDSTPLSELSRKPSHWMPLPAAPLAAKPEGE